MEVMLMKDVESVGACGQMVQVKPGYARNFLLPRGLAVVPRVGEAQELEKQKKKARALEETRIAEIRQYGEKVAKVVLRIPARAAEDNTLFGSVAASQIAEAFQAQGHQIDKKQVVLAEPIKVLGSHEVAVRLHREVEVKVKLWVVAEG